MKNPRIYGKPPFNVVLVHGGPGAPGDMAPVAKTLSTNFGVIEPFQTKDSISKQVTELKEIIKKHANTPVILAGWSWGAWLSFIFTAKHPKLVKKLILISSGPFEYKYAKKIMDTRLTRLSKSDQNQLNSLISTTQSSDHKKRDTAFSKLGKLIDKADSFQPIPHKNETPKVQYDIYNKIWPEASNLRKSRKLLELGKNIDCTVTAIHGDYDPHPSSGVRVPLSQVLPNFQFILLKKCGHHPWHEKHAKQNFYNHLTKIIKTP